ncbi:hypothetical protein F5Y15DRAFT_367603 [Xylariaceae sp. FL0016]|nr:hypothetical protein F5Y15DRAFT_367603 [Xylariaceae sp. FL0016]
MANAHGFLRHNSVCIDHKMDRPLLRELSLYNGVSNRSRGWKTRRTETAMEPSSINPTVMRWDGASRSSATWDNLRRDPELWFRDGNCYIHLYGQGQSRRGPAFKVPFSALLEANCYPLIDRFMSRDVIKSNAHAHVGDYGVTQRQNRIELFIPAPPQSDKRQAYNYHLATRNFIAFVFRRSMVGENLGNALITLMHSMHEFRVDTADNVQDMMSYLDEEGYLNLKCQPSHALAMLHMAEVFQLRDLYIDAFSHCCGMSDQLFLGPEYQLLSSVTRKLVRRARIEMDLRLGQSGSMLRTFLQEDLSEAHLGLYPGARAHLERFRTLLQGLYATKFGYYPPASIDPRTTIFEVDVFRVMRTDFEALYQYLVDEAFDTSQSSPFLAQGGICALQSVQSFDARHKFQTLHHPLPLLPEIDSEPLLRRKSWLGKSFKSNQAQRTSLHAALLKATNQCRAELLDNELVRAYRKFEEDMIYAPIKADKLENLGPADGRKVRWILVYAIYQTLRQATEPPNEVKDSVRAPYNLCISTTHLPPWKENRTIRELFCSPMHQINRSPSTSTASWSTRASSPPPKSNIEIKPDIDYFALTHQASTDTKEVNGSLSRSMSWGVSMSRSLSRKSTVRRPFSIFNKPQTKLVRHTPHKRTPKVSYHEIIVHGYGNGTNHVIDVTPEALQSPVKASQAILEELETGPSSYASSDTSAYSNYDEGTAETPDTSLANSPTGSGACSWSRRSSVCVNTTQDSNCAETAVFMPVMPVPRRARSTCPEPRRPHTLYVDGRRSISGRVESSRPRSLHIHTGSRRAMQPLPLNIRKASTFTPDLEMPSPRSPTAWDYIKAVMEVKATNMGDGSADDIHPEWEQYNDLGGFTDLNA